MALEKFNKVGMRDKETKKVVVFPKFSSIGEFYNGFAITKVITYRNGIQKTKYGYLSEYGVEIPAFIIRHRIFMKKDLHLLKGMELLVFF